MNRERSTVHICANNCIFQDCYQWTKNVTVYIWRCFHRKFFFVSASFADQIVGNSKSFTFPQNIKGIIQILQSPISNKSRFRWLRFVRRRSATVRLLWLRVRTPPMARMFVSLSVVGCQIEVSASGWSLVQKSPTDCGASLSLVFPTQCIYCSIKFV